MARILLVDDEPTLVATLDYNLRRDGHEVVIARDGEAALEQARLTAPDLILLDVMLPRRDGIEVCRELRKSSVVPILLLTARDSEVEKVLGLETGADDYITKPFSMRELLARVKAQLRRTARVELAQRTDGAGSVPPAERFVMGDLEVDGGSRTVTRAGKRLHLKPKEFDLLQFLIQHRGRVLSRDQLLEQVWGYAFSGDSRTIDVHVRWLREKIEELPSRPRLLETVRGIGYRFAG